MALSRCINPLCQRVLDVPGFAVSYRQPDGQCAKCAGNVRPNHQWMKAEQMKVPNEVVAAVRNEPKIEVETTDTFRVAPVEAGFAIPPIDYGKGRRGKSGSAYTGKYPFPEMAKPKDNAFASFFVECKRGEASKLQGAISMAARSYAKTHVKGFKVTVRSVTEGQKHGVRVWRVA